jgi:hypothetical protein
MRGAEYTCGDRRGAYRVFGVDLMESDHLDDIGVDGRIILKCIFKKWERGGMDCISVAQDRDRVRELVNAVMNIRIS